VPVSVIGITNAVSISVGAFHACAVSSTGTAKCWGYNRYGELGDGAGGYPGAFSAVPLTVLGLADATTISVGDNSCAVVTGGAARCWGFAGNSYNLGIGNTSAGSPTPVTAARFDNAVAIEAAGRHNCVLTSDGVVKCWGGADHDQLGNGSGTSSGTDGGRGSLTPEIIADLGNAKSISAGWSHTCAVLDTDTVQCWGNNDYAMASGTFQSWSIATPRTVAGLGNVASVSAGVSHTCAVQNTGSVQCWGSNGNGELGNGSVARRSESVQTVNGLADAVSVSAGAVHTCAVRATGAVQCWGYNNDGQLGDGSTTTVSPYGIPSPVTVAGISNAVAVSASYGHSCALLADKTVKCWGANDYGALGNGTNIDSTTPVSVTGINNAVSISTAPSYPTSCAVLETGRIMCWGYNASGQLGDGGIVNSNVPVEVVGISDAVAVNAGASHTCALLATGAVQCWGLNSAGVLSLPNIYIPSPALPIYHP
jgi:alpha-tubulin suppressor-like RCC1 family protein